MRKSIRVSSKAEAPAAAKRPRTNGKSEFIDSTQTKKMIDLNADCLINLFRYLPLKDLNAIGITCHQFHEFIASDVYYIYKESLKRFDIEAFGRRYPDTDSEHKLDCVKGYLGRYGHVIGHIELDNFIFKGVEDKIFTYIADSCSEALKLLKIRNVKFSSETISIFRFVFANLTNLVANDHLNWPEILPMCVNLEELSLSNDRAGTPTEFNYAFEMLKVFTLKVKQSGRNEQFRTQIETIQLTFHRFEMDEAFINGLSRFRHLRYLSLSPLETVDIRDAVWKQLQQFNNLTEFHLGSIRSELGIKFFTHLTGAHHSLQKMSYNGEHNDHLIASMAQFESLQKLELRKLHMNQPWNDNIVYNWNIFQRLTQLKELSLKGSGWDSTHIKYLLESLSSVDTLEKLEISGISIYAKHFASIGELVNLREFELPRCENVSATSLKIFSQLSGIRKFKIRISGLFGNITSGYKLSQIILELVDNWKSLEHFDFSVWGWPAGFDIESLQNKLIDKSRSISHHSTINVYTY